MDTLTKVPTAQMSLLSIEGIDFKIEERKKELTQMAEDYKKLIVTEENFGNAKKARQKLRETRIEIQKQSKSNRDVLNTLKTENNSIEVDLISIIKPVEEEVDKKIKAIEAIKLKRKEEKARIAKEEQDRKDKLEKEVMAFKNLSSLILEAKSIEKLDNVKRIISHVDVSEGAFHERSDEAASIQGDLLAKVEGRRGEVVELEELRKNKDKSDQIIKENQEKKEKEEREARNKKFEEDNALKSDAELKTHQEEWIYKIVNIKKIPAKHLLLNAVSVNEAIKGGAREIAGLKIAQRKDI